MMDGSLSEMEYALDTLKMDGVSTLTSVEDIYLGDSRFDPWFEEMHRCKVTLFMHPTVLCNPEVRPFGVTSSSAKGLSRFANQSRFQARRSRMAATRTGVGCRYHKCPRASA